MPEDAAVWRPDKLGWTQQDELLATNAELVNEGIRMLAYWLQVVAAPGYRNLTPELPPPFISRFEHPDRPTPAPAPGEGAIADRDLPPVLTPALARSVGLV